MNMYQLLERTAQTWPDNLYLVREGVTYKEFINLVKARAASLDAAGVKKGDVVGILSHNIPEFPITMFAIWYLGGTVLMVEHMLQLWKLVLSMIRVQAVHLHYTQWIVVDLLIIL